jgi:3-hydroxybenzoate 6-monooxygenase
MKVIVVGGGVGGLTAALALAGRHQVIVLERDRTSSDADAEASLQLAPNATRVLRDLGVLDEVRAYAALPRRLMLRGALTGAKLTALELGERFNDRYGAPYVIASRGDLVTTLRAACADLGVTREIATVTGADPEAATVITADGETYFGDAVIAADGAGSVLRALVHRDAPLDSGFVAYRGSAPSDEVASSRTGDVTTWIGPGAYLTQYTMRGGKTCDYVAVFRADSDIDEVVADSCPDVQEGTSFLRRDRRWPLSDRTPLDSLVNGRLALLGDAAHPMLPYLGQGACQAIEDAAALADALAACAPCRADGALAEYDRRRAPRAARVLRAARTWGDVCNAEGVAALMRNELLRRHDSRDYTDIDWLYDPRIPVRTLGP